MDVPLVLFRKLIEPHVDRLRDQDDTWHPIEVLAEALRLFLLVAVEVHRIQERRARPWSAFEEPPSFLRREAARPHDAAPERKSIEAERATPVLLDVRELREDRMGVLAARGEKKIDERLAARSERGLGREE